MSKRVPMSIDEMAEAKQALDLALQRALAVMQQKQAFECTVSLKVSIELDPISNFPDIKYKTNIRVPVEMSENGTAVKASMVEWDDVRQTYMLVVDGEQMKIE